MLLSRETESCNLCFSFIGKLFLKRRHWYHNHFILNNSDDTVPTWSDAVSQWLAYALRVSGLGLILSQSSCLYYELIYLISGHVVCYCCVASPIHKVMPFSVGIDRNISLHATIQTFSFASSTLMNAFMLAHYRYFWLELSFKRPRSGRDTIIWDYLYRLAHFYRLNTW